MDPFLPEAEKVAALREALPAVAAGIFLDTATAGPLPAETIAAMREIEDWEVRIGRSGADVREAHLARIDEARAVLAALIGGDTGAVALTRGTAECVAQAVWSVAPRGGGRIVSTTLEEPDVLAVLRARRDAAGTALELVEVELGWDDERVLAAFEAVIGTGTDLVVISHIAGSTGRRLPIEQVAQLAHRAGAWVVVDGAHAVGAVPVVAEALEADFYAFPCHKWLLGPDGFGGLWIGRRGMEELTPALRGALAYGAPVAPGAVAEHAPEQTLLRDARRFQIGGFHRPSVVGVARTVGWLEMYMGLEWAQTRLARLAHHAARALGAIEGVEVLTPPGAATPIVTFRIAGWPASEAEEELSRRAFAIIGVVPELDALRASIGWFNTEDELGRFVEAVEEVARHTPQTLPRRPTLVVLGSTRGT